MDFTLRDFQTDAYAEIFGRTSSSILYIHTYLESASIHFSIQCAYVRADNACSVVENGAARNVQCCCRFFVLPPSVGGMTARKDRE